MVNGGSSQIPSEVLVDCPSLASPGTSNSHSTESRPGRINEVNQAMKASWEAILPEIEYESIPQDWIGTYAKEFNGKMTKMFLFLSAIATILSCIGLFALVNLIINILLLHHYIIPHNSRLIGIEMEAEQTHWLFLDHMHHMRGGSSRKKKNSTKLLVKGVHV